MKIISIDELLSTLDKYNHKECHVHHTWKPAHSAFNGSNHLQLQRNMRNYHVNTLGWPDIGQHITIMPDGKIVTGRAFGRTPASIAGYNTGAFAIENLGNFDIKGTGSYNSQGYDKLEGRQRETLLQIVKYFIDRKGEKSIIFHRERSSKTCPGTGVDKQNLINETKGVKAMTIVQKGSRGSHVSQLQSNLKELGYHNGLIDGIAGDNTIKSIKVFQNTHNLVVDGIFGKASYDALEKELSKDHWAEKHYQSLNDKGYDITDRRFDDEPTRGEMLALADKITGTVKKKS